MPINDTIYKILLNEHNNFEPDYSTRCIEANRHNFITATYHLIHKRALRNNLQLTDNPTRAGSIDRNEKNNALRVQRQELLDKTNKVTATGKIRGQS